MISRTDAWKTSDGKCYVGKQEAYTAQINILFRELPNIGQRQPTAVQFGKLVKDADDWLRRASLLVRQMKDESDVEVSRSIDGQGG